MSTARKTASSPTTSYALPSPSRRKEGVDRAHRNRNRYKQPVRTADRQRDHPLQLGHLLAPADPVRGERQRQGANVTHANITSGVAAYPVKRALHLLKRRKAHRPGCARGGIVSGVTEISGVPAYNPFVRVGRHLRRARNYREPMQRRFSGWANVVRPQAVN